MTVRVVFFASLRDAAGSSGLSMEASETWDVAALWEALKATHPGLGTIGYRPAAACDMAYAAWDRPLRGVREVAFLPPVSGG